MFQDTLPIGYVHVDMIIYLYHQLQEIQCVKKLSGLKYWQTSATNLPHILFTHSLQTINC